MPTLSSIQQARPVTPPAAIVRVPVSAWASSWRDRPLEEETIGVRPLTEGDVVFARSEAARIALGAHPVPPEGTPDVFADERNAAFNDALLRMGASRGTCDPTDASQPWGGWGRHGGDVLVLEALTVEGARLLWDAIERVTIDTSPVMPQATDEEITELAEKAARATQRMPAGRAARLRRLLRFALNETLEALGEPRA